MLNKKNELEAIVQEENPSIIAITEIKAKRQKQINLVEYNIPGYTMFISKNLHLGAMLYVKDSLNPSECLELNDNKFQEAVWCSFQTDLNQKVLIGCVYKSPSSTQDNIENLLTLLKDNEISKFNKICIVGDFNYPNADWNGGTNSERDQKFIDCTRDIFLHQMVSNVTRRRDGQRSTMDDLVFVNDESMISEITHCSPLGKSDHDVLIFDLYVNKTNCTMIGDEYIFNLKEGNYNKMREEIGQRDWGELENMTVEEAWMVIKTSLTESMEKNIPKVKVKGNKQKPKWLNKKVMKNINKKRNLFKKYLKTKADYDYFNYKKSRKECNQCITKAKRVFERNIAKNSKQNPKQFWKFVQSKTKLATGVSPLETKEGKLAVTDEDKANVLNSFFSSVFTKENLQNIPQIEEAERSNGITLADIQVAPPAVNKKTKGIKCK